jgi:Eukaryotic glutathione synthase, ATP binding domain
MQRIVPPAQRSAFVRRGKLTEDDSLSELGIYGTFLRIGDEVCAICHRPPWRMSMHLEHTATHACSTQLVRGCGLAKAT